MEFRMKTLLFSLLLTASVGQAAPFCAVFSYGKQCHYYSMSSCEQAAGTSGSCITNDEETRPPSGSARFCVVSAYATECYYYDAQSCRQAAASKNGVCKVNAD
jgi:hypothetical protein